MKMDGDGDGVGNWKLEFVLGAGEDEHHQDHPKRGDGDFLMLKPDLGIQIQACGSFMNTDSVASSNSKVDENWQIQDAAPSQPSDLSVDADDTSCNPLFTPPQDGLTILDVLPWEDVLVSRILPFLDLKDLFQLRQVSAGFRDVVSIHFSTNHTLDLSVVGASFTPDAFRVVTADACNLTLLNVACCKKWITDELLLPVIDANRNLQDFSIAENATLSTEVIRMVATRCPELRSLSLAECQQVTATSVESVGMNCENLERLDLRGCWAMDDETLSLVLQLHPHLKWLSVARAYGITDLLVDEICRYCPEVEYLDVQGCWRITDAAIRQLWHMKKLKTLKVKDCRYITERSLSRFRAKGVRVDILLPEESDLAKLERHLRAREFARARSIPPNFML